MELVQRFSQGLAKTSRRGLFGRGAEVATGALLGAASGTLTRPSPISAGAATPCLFPGPPCPCDGCRDTGLCAKPCMIDSTDYAAGCWVTGGVTCCDCECQGLQGVAGCGCGSDYHNDPANCP